MTRKYIKFLLFNLVMSCVSTNFYAQSDCIMYPIENYLDTSKYIFIFHVSDGISDKLQKELPDNFPSLKYKYAKGKATKIFKHSSPKLNHCDEVTIEWDYNFEKGKSYLLFANEVKNDTFKVYSCSHSNEVTNSKSFYKIYDKLNKYFLKNEFRNLVERQ